MASSGTSPCRSPKIGIVRFARLFSVLLEEQAVPHAHGIKDDELGAGGPEQLGELAGAVGLAAAGDAQPGELLGDRVERQAEIGGELQGSRHAGPQAIRKRSCTVIS